MWRSWCFTQTLKENDLTNILARTEKILSKDSAEREVVFNQLVRQIVENDDTLTPRMIMNRLDESKFSMRELIAVVENALVILAQAG
ncbi:MAG: hypothetical protein JWM11_4591 [Planctomycetaceae bacterium]|nr:hypothetical protein [Planctomycetaceae bacterium]